MLNNIRETFLALPASRKTLLFAVSGAGIVLIVSLVLLGNAFANPQKAAQRTPTPTLLALATRTVTVVSTATIPATATSVPSKPTATPIPHPLPVPKDNPPPPPPPPTPTPIPATATPIPPTLTPTVVPPTATPCPDENNCPTPTPPPATSTPIPPTATPIPSPCQPGGAPYYITPTATPAPGVIDQILTSAANRNGLPVSLVKAVAWQESGWQPNVIACDGGIGLMQLMPDTVTWLNQHYGTNDNPYDPAGNADLGTHYLQYYYAFYVGYLEQYYPSACPPNTCDWDTPWPDGTDGATVREIVISVYNEGAGTMAAYGIINWGYVSSVEHFMTQNPSPWPH